MNRFQGPDIALLILKVVEDMNPREMTGVLHFMKWMLLVKKFYILKNFFIK